MGDLLTAEQAAELLRIGRARLWELYASGELVGVKIGRRRLWRREDIDAFIERRIAAEREQAAARASRESLSQNGEQSV